MKKILLTSITIALSMLTYAQVPTGFTAAYLLDRGSLQNVDASGSKLSDLTPTGTVSLVPNRKGTEKHAMHLKPGSKLVSDQTGTSNYRALTVSYWVKVDDQTSGGMRALQFYGNYSGQGSTGFKMELSFTSTETYLGWAGAMYTNGSFRGYSNTKPASNLDDGNWHHIVFRTTEIATDLNVNVFIDNVHITALDGDITTPNGLGDFIRRNTFQIAPTANFDGAIDDVRVYYTSLSNTDIAKLYNEVPRILPSKLFVDINATGNNDGTSWANAYTDLRDAFANASFGIDIWVAKGKYIRQNITDRNATFGWTSDSVKVYGGFAGDETSLSQRSWKFNKTIISGDIGTAGDLSDNCYTVFSGAIGSSTSKISYGLLDGFTIQDGNANQSLNDHRGRGGAYFMPTYVGEMAFNNCEFINNTAQYGGAIYALSSTYAGAKLSLSACKFVQNNALYASGVMVVTNGANISSDISNCLFSNNKSMDLGTTKGGNSVIYVQEQGHQNIDVNISNTTIANNDNTGTGTNYYGSIMVFKHNASSGQGNFKMDNCILWGNKGDVKTIVQHASGTALNSVKINNSISQYTFPVTLGNVTKNNILFQNPQFNDSANNDFRLKSTSPAVDAGTAMGLNIPSVDLSGNTRIINNTIDMGCYEYNPNPMSIDRINHNKWVLYPNPANNVIRLKGNESINQVKIYNTNGQVVFSKTGNNNNNNNNSIDISTLPIGIYTIAIMHSKGVSSKKLIKN